MSKQQDITTKKIAVYGGGSWGTALACQAARRHEEVTLFVRSLDLVKEINQQGTNSKYLGEILLPRNIRAAAELSLDLDLLILAVPSSAITQTIELLKHNGLTARTNLLIATKGVAGNPTELLSTRLQSLIPNKVAFIAGPNFAKEVARGFLTNVTIASEDIELANELAGLLESEHFVITTTNDIITVQIAGAIKNIIAIRSGMYDAIGIAGGCGENAKAALITQGMQEIAILSKALGGRAETLLEPAVLGDLVLTCYSQTSRNTKFGHDLAWYIKQNKNSKAGVATFLANYPYLVEGCESVYLIIELAKKYGLELPTIAAVQASIT